MSRGVPFHGFRGDEHSGTKKGEKTTATETLEWAEKKEKYLRKNKSLGETQLGTDESKNTM